MKEYFYNGTVIVLFLLGLFTITILQDRVTVEMPSAICEKGLTLIVHDDYTKLKCGYRVVAEWKEYVDYYRTYGEPDRWVNDFRKRTLIKLSVLDYSPNHFVVRKTVPYYKGRTGTDGVLETDYVFTHDRVKWSYNFTHGNTAKHRIRVKLLRFEDEFGYTFVPDDNLFIGLVDGEYHYGDIKGNLYVDPLIESEIDNKYQWTQNEPFDDEDETQSALINATINFKDFSSKLMPLGEDWHRWDNVTDSSVNASFWNNTHVGDRDCTRTENSAGSRYAANSNPGDYSGNNCYGIANRTIDNTTQIWFDAEFQCEEGYGIASYAGYYLGNDTDYPGAVIDGSSCDKAEPYLTRTYYYNYNLTYYSNNNSATIYRNGSYLKQLTSIPKNPKLIMRAYSIDSSSSSDCDSYVEFKDIIYYEDWPVDEVFVWYSTDVLNFTSGFFNATADDTSGNCTFEYSKDNSTWTAFSLQSEVDMSGTTSDFYSRIWLNSSSCQLDEYNVSFSETVWVEDINITPVDPYINDTLICQYTFFNATGESGNNRSNITWYHTNGTQILTGEGVDRINDTYFNQNNEIYCTVLPWDGTNTGVVRSSSNNVTINYTIAVNLSIEGYNTTKKWESGTTPNITACPYDTVNDAELTFIPTCIYIGLKDYGVNYTCSVGGCISTDFQIPYVEEVYFRNKSYSNVACWQEQTNLTDASDGSCSQNYTGTYTCSGTWHAFEKCSKTYDTSWAVADYGQAASAGTSAYVEMNYTKPTDSLSSSTWEVGVYNANHSLSLTDCWDYDATYVILRASSHDLAVGNDYTLWECMNDTSTWHELLNSSLASGGKRIVEEAMNWSVNTSTENTYSSVNVEGNNTFGFRLYNWTELLNASMDINSTGYGIQDALIDIGNNGTFDVVLRGVIDGKYLTEDRYSDDTTTKNWEFFTTTRLSENINLSTIGDVAENVTLTLNASPANPEGTTWQAYWTDSGDFNDTGSNNGDAPTWTFDDIQTSVSGRWYFDTSGGATAEWDENNDWVITQSAAAVSCSGVGPILTTSSESSNFYSLDLDMRDNNKRWDFDWTCTCSGSGSSTTFANGGGVGTCTTSLKNTGGTVTISYCEGDLYGTTGSRSGILSLRELSNGNIEVYDDGSLITTVTPPSGDSLEIQVASYAIAECSVSSGHSGTGTGSGAGTGHIKQILQGGMGNNYSTTSDTFSTGTFELISDRVWNTSDPTDRTLDIQSALVNFVEHQPSGCDIRMYLRVNDSADWQEFVDGSFTTFDNDGPNLTFKINSTVSSTDDLLACAIGDVEIIISTDYVANISVYWGGSNDASYTYTSGDLNETNTPLTISINYTDLNSEIEACRDDGDAVCIVPMVIEAEDDSSGRLRVYNITINESLDDVEFSVSPLTTYLQNSTNCPNASALCSVTNQVNNSNGTITFSDLAIRLIGNGNITVNGTAWNQSSSPIHTSLDMIIKYSPFSFVFNVSTIDDLFFNPYSWNQKNVSPYGQYLTRFFNRSIWTLKQDTPSHDIDYYFSFNDTDAWFNKSRGTNYTEIFVLNNTDKNTAVSLSLNTTQQVFVQNRSYGDYEYIYVLMDMYNVSDLPYFTWWEWLNSYCADSGDGYGACVVID